MRVLILAADGFEDSELLVPLYRLKEEGVEVEVAGPKQGQTLTGKHGYSVTADLGFAQLDTDGYDALVLPGGKAPETVRLDERAVSATRRMLDAGKPVAAICHGAQVLISASALPGRKATCWVGIRDDLACAGADYRDEEVIVDGNLITSRCPSDLPAFCRALTKALGLA